MIDTKWLYGKYQIYKFLYKIEPTLCTQEFPTSMLTYNVVLLKWKSVQLNSLKITLWAWVWGTSSLTRVTSKKSEKAGNGEFSYFIFY